MIKASNLSKTYVSEPVFSNVNFVLADSSVVGLIGDNGSGKTTLLSILAGKVEHYDGVLNTDGETIGYLPQEVHFEDVKLVGEFIEKSVFSFEKYKIESALRFLGYHHFDEYQEIKTLSGGEKAKLYLSAVLAQEPTVLLLDEPTNHLDIDSILALSDYLSSFKGKVVTVSHDRAFLDAVVNKIWELHDGKFKEYIGNYATFEELKQQELEIQQKAYVGWVKKRDRLESLIALEHKKGVSGNVGAAEKRFEREVEKVEVKDPFKDKAVAKLNLTGESHAGKLILSVSDLNKSFGEKEILKNISFEIRGNDKIWLYGKNGSGKTTILKEVEECVEKGILDDGAIRIGNNLGIGYYAQTQEILNFDAKLEDEIQRLGKIDWLKAISMLGRLQFDKSEWERQVKSLSYGQRARLIFGAFSLGNYNFLILDEPTNHLDIKTRTIIENALIDYKGAMLIVSHDRYFVERLGINKILFLENGKISKSEIL